MTAPVCFVDCETTGLHPDKHEIWEVALITPNSDEHVWQFPINELDADPFALDIGHYWERHWSADPGEITHISAIYDANKATSRRKRFPDEGRALKPGPEWCRHFQTLTAGRHLAGAVVSFDEERLRRLLWANGVLPRWNYHLIDVENLAVGCIAYSNRFGTPLGIGTGQEWHPLDVSPPWSSEDLSRAVGVDPDQFDRHTALGDAKWAKAIYEAVMGR